MYLQRIIMQEVYLEESKAKEKRIQEKLDRREKQEETLWKSKTRNKWLLEGERNTSFHKTTIQNRQINRISHLKDGEGNILEEHNDIETSLLDHFKNTMKEPQVN